MISTVPGQRFSCFYQQRGHLGQSELQHDPNVGGRHQIGRFRWSATGIKEAGEQVELTISPITKM